MKLLIINLMEKIIHNLKYKYTNKIIELRIKLKNMNKIIKIMEMNNIKSMNSSSTAYHNTNIAYNN
jgi:hypothetical protein